MIGTRYTTQERARRIEAIVPVEFREKGRMRIKQQGRLVNVSMTGLYIGFLHPPHLNEIVEVWIAGDAWDGREGKIRMRGQVRWWRADPRERALPRGFGVKILDFSSPEARDRYRAVVAQMEENADEDEEAAEREFEDEDDEETIVD